MRRLALVAAAGLALAAPASGGRVQSMQVVADEYTLQVSRGHVGEGKLEIELDNFGMDPHDVKIQKWNGSGPAAGTGEVLPGHTAILTVKLKPGRYRLWCSLLDHQARGMETSVVVRAR